MSTAKEDWEKILNEAIDLACYFLRKSHEFYPFAVVMHPLGEIQHMEGYTGEERPRSQKVLDLLAAALREYADNGAILCAAIVSDVRLTTVDPPTDATCVHLEHAEEEPMVCHLPYSWNDGNLGTAELFGQSTEALVFKSLS